MDKSVQELFWRSEFGKQYNDRNLRDIEELDRNHIRLYGVTRSELNREFLGELNIHAILECGCGVGNQLLLLAHQGYERLCGIDIQEDALGKARSRLPHVGWIQASLSHIPFQPGSFDLSFTSGVLIHINPDHLLEAMRQIFQASGSYVWGYEYYHDSLMAMEYRGHTNKLWKADYCRLYMEHFPLRLIKRKKLVYRSDSSLIDEMFLLQKMETPA